MKYEIAEELGLLDRVLAQGWKSLTSKETGRIGGLVTKKKTDAGERDSTDGGKNIEKPEAERSYFDKTTHF